MVSCKRNNVFIAPIGMVGLTILSGAFLISNKVNADDSSVSTATITVPVSCSMIGVINTAHTAEIPNGIDSRGSDYYPNGIGQTTLKAFCNDNNGFSIYAVGYTGDTIGNTYLRDSTLGQTDDIQTSTTFSGANSAWAMKLGATTGTYTPIIAGSTADSEKQAGDTDYSTWAVVPSSYQRVAYRNSATDLDNGNIAAEGAQLTTTYAAYISPTQKAGTYVGKVKYTLVHPVDSEVPLSPQIAASGCISYFPNGGNVVGTMGCQSISASDSTANLFASNFSRVGYGFAGWSDTYDYKSNPNANFYGPNETITFTAGQYSGSNPGLSLYAIWVKSVGTFQDSSIANSVCSDLTMASVNGVRTLASVSALTDNRDNQTYAIAKLADGKCWMIENLRLDNTAQLTTLNTNNPFNDGTSVTLKHNYTDTQTYNTLSSTSSVAYEADVTPDGWCTTFDSAACVDQSRLRTSNTVERVSYAPTKNMTHWANIYSYGNYYNWYSATAGQGTYSFDTKNNSVIGDICPIGWRIPRGGDLDRIESNNDNDFWNLVVNALNGGIRPKNNGSYYDGTAQAGPIDKLIRTYPNNYIYSGSVSGGSINHRGNYGYYWSSTTTSSYGAYDYFFWGGIVGPGTYSANKYFGFPIRCLASGM